MESQVMKDPTPVTTTSPTTSSRIFVPLADSGFVINASFRSDIGCHRDVNEDCWLLEQSREESLLKQKGILALVADGMGGHAAGDVASKLAASVIRATYYDSAAPPAEALEEALHSANRALYQMATKQSHLRGMGTTCTALVLWNDVALLAQVGDSRLYLVRNDQIYLMSEDHSAVMEMVRRGAMSLADARQHEDKNIILRALGPQPNVEVSLWQTPFPLRDGDQFVLCSDGLYDLVRDEEMQQIVNTCLPSEACEQLIALANERGGHDNITVGVVQVKRI
ncbi:MAG TPA: Stp1/IreP family PP2C-type Ser/Thr phosphatase [Blastocatellia bacterium]|nr:Stp1/IreP family PP2C-type Ser/Thr phosphatase [Blastocatellia bacterium]